MSFPPLSKFPGKSKNIKPESTQNKEPQEDLIDGCCGKDARLFLSVGSGMNISHDRGLIVGPYVTNITVLFIDGVFFAMGCIPLMASDTIAFPIGLAEVLFFMGHNPNGWQP